MILMVSAFICFRIWSSGGIFRAGNNPSDPNKMANSLPPNQPSTLRILLATLTKTQSNVGVTLQLLSALCGTLCRNKKWQLVAQSNMKFHN
jgi:hypothetical protein